MEAAQIDAALQALPPNVRARAHSIIERRGSVYSSDVAYAIEKATHSEAARAAHQAAVEAHQAALLNA